MKQILSYLYGTFAGALLVCILMEQWSLYGIGWGSAIGWGAAACFGRGRRKMERRRPFAAYLRYGAVLLIGIYREGIGLALRTVRPRRFTAAFVRAHTKSKAGTIERTLIANSITLTPGTITIDEETDSYQILCVTSDQPAEHVTGEFEAVLFREET